MDLNPLEVSIRGDYANLLLHTGRQAEALATIDEALARDTCPPSWLYYVRGKILFFMKRYRETVAVLDSARVDNYKIHALLAAAYALQGNLDDARRHVALMKAANSGLTPQHITLTLPFSDPRLLDSLCDGLARAGFRIPTEIQ